MKPPKFNDSLCDDSRTHQEIEAIQLLLAVTSSSYYHDETLKTSQTRVSRIRVSEMTVPMYHTPFGITASDVSSSGQTFHSSDLSMSIDFYSLKADM